MQVQKYKIFEWKVAIVIYTNTTISHVLNSVPFFGYRFSKHKRQKKQQWFGAHLNFYCLQIEQFSHLTSVMTNMPTQTPPCQKKYNLEECQHRNAKCTKQLCISFIDAQNNLNFSNRYFNNGYLLSFHYFSFTAALDLLKS